MFFYHVPLVSLVRRYVGFGDEDPVEIQRIKETLKAQEECKFFRVHKGASFDCVKVDSVFL